MYCLDSLGDSLGRVVLRHVADVVWKASMKVSDCLLFFQDEDTKQDDEEGDEAAARCAPHEDRRRVGKAAARCQERSNSE